jgi:hypothetical protein
LEISEKLQIFSYPYQPILRKKYVPFSGFFTSMSPKKWFPHKGMAKNKEKRLLLFGPRILLAVQISCSILKCQWMRGCTKTSDVTKFSSQSLLGPGVPCNVFINMHGAHMSCVKPWPRMTYHLHVFPFTCFIHCTEIIFVYTLLAKVRLIVCTSQHTVHVLYVNVPTACIACRLY